MRKLANRKINRWIFLLFISVMTAGLTVLVHAVQQSPRIVKVAFPQVPGMSETAEDGSRYGLVVDYLNEIAKYTGWEYEYIDIDNSTDMLNDFADGKYELMGGNYYLPGLEEHYAYPDFNIGYSTAVFLARWDDASIRSYDLESLNGKTIGYYERATETARRMKEFLAINNLSCTLKPYKFEQLSKDGTLYAYLESGEVDLLLGNSGETRGAFRKVATFRSQPYYIVTNVGNQEILDGLNMALERILESTPDFATERYNANFTETVSVDIRLNEKELAYIEQKKIVTVAVPQKWHPLFCIKTENTPHNGVVPDILDEVAQFTGLEFTYVYADSYLEAIRMVQRGEADILGFFLGSDKESVQYGLSLTSSYAQLNNIVVRNKSVAYPAPNLTGAVVEGRELPSNIQAAEVREYSDVTDALSAVNSGEIDFIYGLSSLLESEIQGQYFTNLVPVTLVNDRNNISFALPRPSDCELFTIMNKAINTLTIKEKNTILDRNVVSSGVVHLSLKSMIYSNPILFIVLSVSVLSVLAAVILVITRTRTRAAILKSNLEKAEAANQAKIAFLSRMSHEIRTPMNAVMGLVDLTSMRKDLPEEVGKNLSQIQSSSRYLLALVNDILDMSRIENGMLSIAEEPFHLGRMLNEVQSMMGGEAKRRGVNFTIEKEIKYNGVIGDVIRLRQVLTNLLSNAIKFTSAGGNVTLRIVETACDESHTTLHFQVIDNGIGIALEDQKQIFEAFEQAGSNHAKSMGTGLGLPISRSLVQAMGGELCVESTLGQGSTFFFTITLPVGAPEECVTDDVPVLSSSQLLQNMRILLVEDNDINAQIVSELLESQGAFAVRCENGKQAVETFENSAPGQFHAILMDIQMPEMNGLEATAVIRNLDRADAATIPIIAMTANTFQEDVDAAIKAGMNQFLSKPLDVKEFYHLLHSLLKN